MPFFIRGAAYRDTAELVRVHHHDAHQILFVSDGSARLLVNNEDFRLKKGDLVFISSMESHAIDEISPDYKRYEIKISPDILNAGADCLRLYSVLLNRPEGFSRVIALPLARTEDLFRQIVAEFNGNGAYRKNMLSLLPDILFIDIYRLHPEIFAPCDNPRFELVQDIQRQFEGDLSRNYRLDQLAEEHHVNKYYLSHIFKDITGYSVMDYLKAVRMARAKALLCGSSLSISEIVKTCGFSDASNFSRKFRSITRLSPKDYRKKHQETEEMG